MTEFDNREIEKAVLELIKICKESKDLTIDFCQRLLDFSDEARRKIGEGMGSETSPLFIAANRGGNHIAWFLLEMCDVDVDQVSISPDQDGNRCAMTPLCAATYKGDIDMMRLLISYGANVNQTVNFQIAPLFVASRNNNLETVQQLVKSGADVNLKNEKGQTSLMMALKNVQVCRYLLENDAKVNAEDVYLKTALQYATEQELEDTVTLLEEYKATMMHNYPFLVLCHVAVAYLEAEETPSSSRVPVQPNI